MPTGIEYLSFINWLKFLQSFEGLKAKLITTYDHCYPTQLLHFSYLFLPKNVHVPNQNCQAYIYIWALHKKSIEQLKSTWLCYQYLWTVTRDCKFHSRHICSSKVYSQSGIRIHLLVSVVCIWEVLRIGGSSDTTQTILEGVRAA